MFWMTDEEVTEIINNATGEKYTRETITRWRNRTRNPNQDTKGKFEIAQKLPIDVIYRGVNLFELEERLKEQLKGVKKLQKQYEKSIS